MFKRVTKVEKRHLKMTTEQPQHTQPAHTDIVQLPSGYNSVLEVAESVQASCSGIMMDHWSKC